MIEEPTSPTASVPPLATPDSATPDTALVDCALVDCALVDCACLDSTLDTALLDHSALSPEAAYRIVHDALLREGDPRKNLATFTTTWMEPEAGLLLHEAAALNMAEGNTAPLGAAGPPVLRMEAACLAAIGRLWHVPDPTHVIGCSTVGSSEACMLAGIALKRRWQARTGGGAGRRPNLVLGTNVQVCWKKFCNYWDVEARLVDIDEQLTLDPTAVAARCDEDTIAVVAVLGSTLDGSYDPVQQICAALDALAAGGGPDVPVHVDAASGGLVAPFLDDTLVWDFQLPRVASINTSGHKYGMVFPGLGWALWRDEAALPRDLVLSLNYLGGEMLTFGLNFSRPGSGVVAQYYEFVREGFTGLRDILGHTRQLAGMLADRLDALPGIDVLTRGTQTPVVTFTTALGSEVDAYALSRGLHERGWRVPAYALPGTRSETVVLRAVCRRDFSSVLITQLVADVRAVLDAG